MNVGHIRPCWSPTRIIATFQVYRKTLCKFVDFAVLGYTTYVGSCLLTFRHRSRFLCYMTHIRVSSSGFNSSGGSSSSNNNNNNNRFKLQIMKLHVTQLSPTHCYIVSARSRHFSQHFFHRHPLVCTRRVQKVKIQRS
jgi:hypothetical protein